MPEWPMVALEDVLRRHNHWIELDPEAEYRQVTVRLWGKGVALRGVCRGADIAAREQVQVQAGQFIMSRIDARHGAFGLVPHELDGAVVSGDFPCFDVDTGRLLPGFLFWLSRTEPFIALCRGASEGSTNRVRLKEDRFLASRIPLPSLDEQRRIVARLNAVDARLKTRIESAERQEAELAAMLRNAFVRITAGSPRAPMAKVAPLVRRPVTIEPGATYEEIGARAFGRGLFAKPDVRGESLTWQKLFWIEEGDLVISNIKAWEGAFAVAEYVHHGKVASHRYLTCVADRTRLLPSVLCFYLQSPEGLGQVQAASPGSADRNRTLAQDRLKAIEVPVPSLDAQQWFEQLQTKVGALRAQHAATAADCDALLPAMLHNLFGTAAC
ncbi:restriction endonuclease subunit S [Pseudoroseomonas rhizosphaerae]|uniref:Restriction endonuclease subunit S n=2 Tax=Teichococcus rhizosphaerae TaxID=1335062 RepID=A0A2C7A9Z1_9PROT|nr:restriction endonuclease subunit S [Pseudoroseomonas rhizosphaerae]